MAPDPIQAPSASLQPGRRAKLTSDALLVASNKVIQTLDDKAIHQCFPPQWATEYPDLIPGLKDLVKSTYRDAVPLAWNDLQESADFVSKANELDAILEHARARKEAGEEPRDLYKLGTDGTITIPSLTVPQLRTSIEQIRQKRQALASLNTSRYALIARLSERATTQEAQNEAILSSFAASVKALEEVDQEGLQKLQDELVRVVGKDL